MLQFQNTFTPIILQMFPIMGLVPAKIFISVILLSFIPVLLMFPFSIKMKNDI